MFVASLVKLRQLCLALPETTEVGAIDHPTFGVNGKTFATCHQVSDRDTVWFKASTRTRRRLLASGGGSRFFTPPYMGHHGWVGAWLDDNCDWAELEKLLSDSHRMTSTPHALRENVSSHENVARLTLENCRREQHFGRSQWSH